MKSKLKLLALLTTCFLLVTLMACSDAADEYQENNPSDRVELGALTVGLMPSIDAFPIVIAHERGYFEDEGLTVHLEPFSSAASRDDALEAGRLDAATVDLVAVGLSIEAGNPLRVTGATSGRFTLVANEGFYNIEDLAGESVVISAYTAIDFVLDQMVERAGFELNHINRMIVPSIPERMELLREGQVTAAVLPEPWATIAMADGLYGITNTIEMGFVPFVISFTDDALATQQADIQAFYRAYNRAVDFLNATPLEDYFHIMVDVIGFPADVADHLILPEFTHNQMPADDVLEAAIEWLVSRGLISDEMTVTDLVNTIAFD